MKTNMYPENHPFNEVAGLISAVRDNARKVASEGHISPLTYQKVSKSADMCFTALNKASGSHSVNLGINAAGQLHEAVNHLTDAAGILFKDTPNGVYLSPEVMQSIDPHVTGAHIGNYLADVSPIRTEE